MSALTQLYEEINRCQRCPLSKTRTRAVPGDGPEDAEVMFVGEAPGWHEDQQGKPFVGPAGKYLNQLLNSIDLDRDKVYITNIIKSRPTGNRDPLPAEITACHPWLVRQIELIKPKILVTLGRYSMALFFPGKTIGGIHGQEQRRDGVIYFPMYHPAAALHQQGLRPTIEADMLKIPRLLAEAKGVPEAREEPPQKQLNMF
jgi:uracil-DNA glycosylase family 4